MSADTPRPAPATAEKGRPAADSPVLQSQVPAAAAVASFPHGTVFVVGHDLRYTHVGGEHLTSLGRDRLEYVGRTVYEMFDEAAAAVRVPAYRRALAGENVVIDAPLNDDRVLEMHLSPLLGADGAVEGAIGYTLDVTELRRGAQTLRDSQEQFRLAFEKAPIGMALAGTDGTLFRCNPALGAIFGVEESSLVGVTLLSLTHPADASAYLRGVRDLFEGRQETFQTELRYRRPAGGPDVWALLVCTLVRTAHERPLHLMAQISDVTQRREAQDAAAAGHAFQEAVLSASPDVIYVREVGSAENVWTSRSVLDMLGYTAEQITELGPSVYDRLIPESDRARFDAAWVAAEDLEDGQIIQLRHRALHSDGSYRWVSRRLTPFLRDADGRVRQILGVSRDVTDTVVAQERLEHTALHDELTGLPNRRLVHDRLGQILRSRTSRAAVLYCDLDGFKQVNDRHGHDAGDMVLVESAARLRSAVRDTDTVGRLGGDEFVVVLHVERDEDAGRLATDVADRIQAALRLPLQVHGATVGVTASIGIAIPAAHDVVSDVLRRADQAMYQAKDGGRDQHVTFGRPAARS